MKIFLMKFSIAILTGTLGRYMSHIPGSHNDVSVAYLLVMQMELVNKPQNQPQRSIDHVKCLSNKVILL